MAGQIDHPILITECACNPVQSRGKMAELLFESYGVPSVGMNTYIGCLELFALLWILMLLNFCGALAVMSFFCHPKDCFVLS